MTETDEQTIRPMTMVRRVFDERFKEYWKLSPFVDGRDYIFLGEIIQMPGHGVFIDMQTGQTFSGYHIDEFRESREDETSATITLPFDLEDDETDSFTPAPTHRSEPIMTGFPGRHVLIPLDEEDDER